VFFLPFNPPSLMTTTITYPQTPHALPHRKRIFPISLWIFFFCVSTFHVSFVHHVSTFNKRLIRSRLPFPLTPHLHFRISHLIVI
jgi:hypothetical protein